LKQDARIGRREGREHDHVGELLLPLLLLVEILDARGAVALRAHEHPRDGAVGADLDSRFLRYGR